MEMRPEVRRPKTIRNPKFDAAGLRGTNVGMSVSGFGFLWDFGHRISVLMAVSGCNPKPN
jgi:hypothetical protein